MNSSDPVRCYKAAGDTLPAERLARPAKMAGC